jgi:hypothetical protein
MHRNKFGEVQGRDGYKFREGISALWQDHGAVAAAAALEIHQALAAAGRLQIPYSF